MALFVVGVLLFQLVSASEIYRNDGILHHLNKGMQIAKEFLGSESVALKVADFVVRAFQPANNSASKRKPLENENENNFHQNVEDSSEDQTNQNINKKQFPSLPWRHVVKLLGLQPTQISAVAVNALILIAQMITTFLSGPKKTSKMYSHDDPVKWMLNKNSRNLQELITAAKNESLPDLLNELIEEQESGEETSCIRLLVCKITPFIIKMQKAVFEGTDNQNSNTYNIHGSKILYRHLPTNDEINERSNICERKFKDCDLNE